MTASQVARKTGSERRLLSVFTHRATQLWNTDKKRKKKVDDAVDDNDGDDNDGDEFKIVSALKINGKVQFMGRIGWVALINEIIIIVVVVVIMIIIAITNTIIIVVINSSQVYM